MRHSKVPVLVERCGDVRELDRLVNAERSRINGIGFLFADPFILANVLVPGIAVGTLWLLFAGRLLPAPHPPGKVRAAHVRTAAIAPTRRDGVFLESRPEIH